MKIPYNDNAFDGINNFLFNKKGLPIEHHVVAEGVKYSEEWGDPIIIVDPLKNSGNTYDNFASYNSESLSYFTIQYKSFLISVNNYTIRTRTHNLNDNFPNSWKVEGSNDGNSWNLIHSISKTNNLSYVNAYKTYPSHDTNYYSFFRFKMTEKTQASATWDPSWVFHVSKVEFFGSLAFTKNPYIKQTCIKYKTSNFLLFITTILKS